MGENNQKGRAGIKWDDVVEKIWKDLGGEQEEVLSIEKLDGYKTEVNERIGERERLALRNKVKEKHLDIYGGLREDIGVKTYLHGPMDYAKKLKTAISCRGPGPTRKKIYTSSGEEDVATNMCTCGTTIESGTHIVGECQTYEEERDA